jgi:hypothetical protein
MPGSTEYVGCANYQNVTLLASAARLETGTGDAVSDLGEFGALVLQLDVTAAATAAGDTLDVTVQTTIDGTNWVDIHHFTQILGNGGAKRYYAKIVKDVALTEFENAAALAAAASRSILGNQYRVRWAITDATTDDASFTFSVKANAIA